MTYQVTCQGLPSSPASFHTKHFQCGSHAWDSVCALSSTWNTTLLRPATTSEANHSPSPS